MTYARALSGTLLFAALALPTMAAAQSRDDVEAQHERGNRLREQGRHADARDLFRGLFERTHDPRALVRQGLAEMALQEWIAADEHLRAGLATQGNRWVDENRQRIQGALREVGSHVGSLVVQCAPPEAQVFVNDTARGTCSSATPLRLAVGNATVRVQADGVAPETRTAAITAGDTPTTLSVQLAAPAPAHVDMSWRDRAEASNRRRTLMFGLGGAALGLGAVGLGLGAYGYFAEDDTTHMAPANETLGIVGFAAGGALVVTGIVLMVTAPRHRSTELPENTAYACAPSLGVRGIACAVTF